MRALILGMLLFAGMVNAQTITFPDDNFRLGIINASGAFDLAGNMIQVDQNSDGQIQFAEAANISRLFLEDGGNVTDITGVEYFTNMWWFSCRGNQVTSINLIGNTSITRFDCSAMSTLTYLNLSGMTQLTDLMVASSDSITYFNVSNCSSLGGIIRLYNSTLTYLNAQNCASLNEITVHSGNLNYLNFNGCSSLLYLSVEYTETIPSLIVSDLPNLQTLNLYQNPALTNLSIVNCPSLTTFYCDNGGLTSIDLSGLTNLTSLRCRYTPVTALDVSNLVNLTDLWCSSTMITTLDLSNLQHLTYLNYGMNTQLQTVYQKNGQNDPTTLGGCPNLAFICADEGEVVSLQNAANASSGMNTEVNSYCSFVPGGDYNTISGTIRFDSNTDGCDSSDPVKKDIRVNIDDNTNQGATFSDSSGVYNFYTLGGNFTLTPVTENQSWFNITPTSATIPFADNNNNNITQDFCISPNGTHQDVEVVVEPISTARPGFYAYYKIVCRNKGNNTTSGNVNFTYDDTRMDFVAATIFPDSGAAGSMTWNYSDLLPFETKVFGLKFYINSPTDSPSVNVGDQLPFGTTITPTAVDEIPADNSFAFNQTVVGSYDPNNISCIEGDNLATTEIGKYLHYVVNFENTGNASAENIVVRNVIDTTKYDINNLQLQDSSNECYTRITGNVVEFIFQNINLEAAHGNPPVGGHGDVLFKIKTKDTLVENDTVLQKSGIYFDYNFPVITNDAETTFAELSNPIFEFDNSIRVYPNPTKSIININSDFQIETIELYDVQGRILERHFENAISSKLDISSKSNGIYFLKIKTEKGSKVEKVVKK